MKKSSRLKDSSDNLHEENIKNRIKNLFPKKEEFPAYLSMREAEALRTRVAELEAKLAQEQPAVIQEAPISNQDIAVSTNPNPARDIPAKPGKRNLWQWLVEPPAIITDTAERRQARLVSTLLLILVASIANGPFAQFYILHNPTRALILAAMGISFLIAYIFSRTKYYRLAVPFLLIAVSLWPILSMALTRDYSPAGLLTTFVFDTLVIIISGTLASFRTTAFLSIVNFLGLLLLTVFTPAIQIGDMIVPLSFNGVVSILVLVFMRHRSMAEQDRLSEMAQVNRELQASYSALDARTGELNLAVEVTRSLSRLHDLNTLLTEAVNLIQNRFGLYHAQVYLTDPARRTLVLSAGTGQVGTTLIHRGHHLLIGPGSLNGRVAAERRALIISDTNQSRDFLPNPLLPNTRSEMAIPLIAGGELLGVLDLQSERPEALNKTNLPAFETLAGQLSIAVQNASLLASVEEARSELEMQIRYSTEKDWQDFLDAIDRGQKIGFAFEENNLVPLEADQLSVAPTEAFSMPINVTGAKIGSIQIADEPNRTWNADEVELIKAAASQLGQHVENLRLLAQAEKYRAEAEDAVHRLTHEGWNAYLQEESEDITGFIYNLNQVNKLDTVDGGDNLVGISQPLTVRDEMIGELSIHTKEGLQEAEEILSAVSTQLSTHLENLRLTNQTESALGETESLYKASAELNAASTYLQILDVVRRHTLLGRGAQNVSLNFFDRPWTDDKQPATIEVLARWSHLPDATVLNRYPLATFPSARQLLHSDVPTLIEDVATDSRMDENARELYAKRFGAVSTIFIPLVIGGQWVGYINGIYQQATKFPETEVRHLMNLASQAAVAINNTRLLILTQERAQREQTLRQITDALRNSTNPETIMRTAARELGRILGRPTMVQMTPPQQGSRVKANHGDDSSLSEDQPKNTVGGNA